MTAQLVDIRVESPAPGVKHLSLHFRREGRDAGYVAGFKIGDDFNAVLSTLDALLRGVDRMREDSGP